VEKQQHSKKTKLAKYFLTAKKAPTRARDHPIPLSSDLSKKGSGTSNHKSLDPNRNTRDRDSTLMLWLFLHDSLILINFKSKGVGHYRLWSGSWSDSCQKNNGKQRIENRKTAPILF
jgi:hypothetical protein